MAYIRCSTELHRIVKIEAAKRGLDMGELTAEAVKRLLEGPDIPKPHATETAVSERYPSAFLADHDVLQFVLDGDPQAAEWIRGNLHMFAEAIRSRQGSQKRRKTG